MKKQLLILMISMIFMACNKDTNLPERSDLSAAQIQKLRCNGFNPDHVEYKDGQYLVDGDYLISDEHLIGENLSVDDIIKTLETNSSKTESRGISTGNENSNKIAINNSGSIKYYVDPLLKNQSISSAYWYQAIKDAIKRYNDLTKCKLNFTEVSTKSSANLKFFLNSTNSTVRPPNWNQSVTGLACFPKNGLIGEYIGLLATNNVTKFRIILHEIGHAVGYRHTCFTTSDNETPTAYDNCGSSVGQHEIKGTPLTDCSSVMRPGLAGAGNTDFNSNDITGLEYMYPNSYNIPSISSITKYQAAGSWYAKIKTLTLPSPQVPYRIVVARYTPAGSLVGTHVYYGPTNNNIKEFNVPVSNGIWLYKVWYMNHGAYGVSSTAVSITI